MMLAVCAVPIAAGSIDDMRLTAFLASINGGAVMSRSAVDNGIDDFAVLTGHGRGEAIDILGCEVLEDLLNCHGHLLSSDR